MFRTTLLSTLILTLVLLASPATAGAQDEKWQLRFGGVWVDPDVGFTDVDSDGDRVEAGADSGFGLGLSVEGRFSSRLGLEIGALFAQPDVTLDADLAGGPRFSVSDDASFTAITASLNFHLTPDKAVDLYVGPSLVYALYGDLGFDVQVGGQTLDARFSSANDFALGAQIGADVPFGDGPWSLNLSARYLDTVLEVTDEDGEVTDLDFDPLILGVGFGYRF